MPYPQDYYGPVETAEETNRAWLRDAKIILLGCGIAICIMVGLIR